MVDKDDEHPHPSPYKIGNWTVTRLREELKSRRASTTGNKEELLQRLEQLEEGGISVIAPKENRPASLAFHASDRVEG